MFLSTRCSRSDLESDDIRRIERAQATDGRKTFDDADRFGAKHICVPIAAVRVGEMYMDSSVRLRETSTAARSNEFSEGLTLLRASTLKIIRLQLAIERHDRLAALAAVDDLVALDSQLQDYLDATPAAENQGLRRTLDGDRFALNQEETGARSRGSASADQCGRGSGCQW